MNYEDIRFWLENYDHANVKQYASKVITDSGLPIRGIPMPGLREMAKSVPAAELPGLLRDAEWDSFEEVLLLGLAVAYAKLPLGQKLPYLRRILPRLDSWAMTDTIAPTLRPRKDELEMIWVFALECLESPLEYTVRFGVVLLMDYFPDGLRLPQVLQLLAELRDPRYYVQMAVAWCLAEIAVKNAPEVLRMLESGCLDPFTHNKTIQKLRESRRIDPVVKEAAAGMRRKDTKQ